MSAASERELADLFRASIEEHGERAEELLALLIVSVESNPPSSSMRASIVARVLSRADGPRSGTAKERILRHLALHPLPSKLERDLTAGLIDWLSDARRPRDRALEMLASELAPKKPVQGRASDAASLLSLRLRRSAV